MNVPRSGPDQPLVRRDLLPARAQPRPRQLLWRRLQELEFIPGVLQRDHPSITEGKPQGSSSEVFCPRLCHVEGVLGVEPLQGADTKVHHRDPRKHQRPRRHVRHCCHRGRRQCELHKRLWSMIVIVFVVSINNKDL